MQGISIFDDDKSAIDKMQNSFKNLLFEIIYYLISGENFPLFLYIFFVMIESFQVFYFAFSDEFLSLWKIKSWSESFQQFFGYFMISPYLKNVEFQSFILVLYIVMGLFFLLIVLIIFIAIKAQTTSVGKLTGPLVVLKIFFEILNYIFFMPTLHLFLTVFYCDSGTGYHHYYSDLQCYTGNYLLHAFLSAIAALILICVSGIVTMTFYESRFQANNPLCKTSGRDDMKFLIFKIVLVLCFTLLNVSELRILVVIIITLFAVIQFFSFNKSSVYLNYYYSKILNSQHAIIMWTICMIIFGIIVEDTYYEGAPYLWVFGSPLLLLIVMLRKEYRYDIMMIDSNKFDSLNQAIQQLQYLTKFLNYYHTDKNIATLLDGFVEYHRTICKREDCPCQAKNMGNKKIAKFQKNFKLQNQDDEIKEQYVVLVYILERIFTLSLTRFPNCTELRIAHSLFLMEKMQSNQQALQELVSAEQEKPYMDEQFIIYRLKKLIEEQMFENSKSTKNPAAGIDAVNELTTENNLREIRAQIEKSASQHIEFWSQLSEDTPDLGKLYDVGTRMMYIDKMLEDSWKRIIKMNIDVPPNLMMIYSRYLVDILYDKESAEEVLERLKNFYSVNMDRGKITNNINDFPNESTALISISAEDITFGRIIGLNMSASKMFGYSKSELINRKVNILMPNVFAQSHDQFMETYLQTYESRIMNRERMIIGKSKNGYIFPFFIYVRYVPSFIHGAQFFGAMRQEKVFKNVAFMIVNGSTQEIENISATFITMFHIDLNYITKKKTKVSDLIPNFQENITEYLNKTGAEAEINFKNRDQSVQGKFNITAGEILFRDSKLQGYIIKIENNRQEKSFLNPNEQSQIKKQQQVKFYFQFDQSQHNFIGEYTQDQNFQMSAISSVKQDETFDYSQREPIKEDEKTPTSNIGEKEEKVDLAFGIRTMKYINGQLYDIEDFKNQDSDEDGEENDQKKGGNNGMQQVQKEDEEEEAEGGHANIYKSRRTFVQFLSESRNVNQSSMICFKWSAAILIICLGILGLLDYVLTQQLFQDIQEGYIMMQDSNIRVALGQRIQWQIMELCRLNKINVASTDDKVKTQLANMNTTISDLKDIQSKIQSSTDVSGRQNELMTTNSIKMISRDDSGSESNQLVDINQGTSQIISKAFEIMNYDITDFDPDSDSIFFIRYNLLNDYYQATLESVDLYTNQLIDLAYDSNVLLILLIVACVFTVISIPWIACAFNLVSQNQEEVIKLFLEIPLAKVKQLFAKCEAFSNTLQIGEDEDANQENELSFEENDEGEGVVEEFGRRKKRKKYKYDSKDKRNFYIKFIISIGLLIAYFIAHYLIGANLQGSMQQLIQEMNATSMAVPSITFANNVFRQMLWDGNFPVKNNVSKILSADFVKDLYNLNTNMQKDHSLNLGYHNAIYNDYFDAIMKAGACNEVIKVAGVDLATCQAFVKGIVDESLALALSRHFENLRYLLTVYDSLLNDSTATTIAGTVYNFTNNIQQNKILSLMYTDISAIELNQMQDIYIRSIFQQLLVSFNESMQKDLDTNTTTTVTIFIVFLVVLVLVYLLFWWPIANKINNEIRRTTLLLSMIPLNLIQRIKAVREYLNRIHKVDS
ncbi:unnamed protein product [Paramecium primaurelia]|uniref:PAS domain-containing protein n=1 Tax=Paramecium primaurelia TaxID=5886 RepID=A0A8S1NEJ1_PARPR|nr:unnamed protein product [Paramecium primaurelia]